LLFFGVKSILTMSRLPRENIWFQQFGVATWAVCPVCGYRNMNRDWKFGEPNGEWHREHIIRLAVGGPDTYPNLIPICGTCNLGMGKDRVSTFDFMVKIGRMTLQQSEMELQRHRMILTQFDPRCEAYLKNGEKRCSNLKAGKSEQYCKMHIKREFDPMDCSEDT